MKNSTKIWISVTTVLCVATATLVAMIYNDNKKHPANFEPTKFNLKKEPCEINGIEQREEDRLTVFLSHPIDCYSVKYRGHKMILSTFTYTNEPQVTSIDLSTINEGEYITEINLQEKNSRTPRRDNESTDWQLV